MKAGFHNIDRGFTDIFAARSKDGDPIRTRIDNISFVSHVSSGNRDELRKRLDNLKSSKGYMVKKDRTGSAYYEQIVSIWRKGQRDASLRIEYSPWADVRGYIRFELSPQVFGPEGINKLFAWLSLRDNVGRNVYRILKEAWVTRVDFAVDIYGFRLRNTHINLKGARTGEVHELGGDFDGFCLGASASEFHASCYEKVKLVGFDRPLGKTEEIDLRTVDHKRFSRIEIRWRPDAHQIPLSRLFWATNMLERVKFYDRSLELNSKLPAEFRELISTSTIPEALAGLKGGGPERRRKREKINRILDKHEFQLFNTEEVWGAWFECVEQLGILGRPQDW